MVKYYLEVRKMLRKILYADTEALDNYISIIDGYTYEEQEIIQSTTTNKGGKAGIGFKATNIGGNFVKQNEEKISLNAKITDASKLDKIIRYLKSEDSLKYYESINEEIWKDIYRDDFIEVLVTPRFSKLEEVTNAANTFKQLVNAFEPFLGENYLDKKTTNALSGFERLSNSQNKNSLSCVFNFEDKKYPMIGNIDKMYLKTSKDNFVSQVYMLCKIQRKIEKGNSICLDEIFEDVKSMALNREQRRKMIQKDMSNPAEIKDKINGPAFVVIPIAIYQ